MKHRRNRANLKCKVAVQVAQRIAYQQNQSTWVVKALVLGV